MKEEKIVKAGTYFAWSDSLMLAEGDCRVSAGCMSGNVKQLCNVDMDMERDEGRELVERIAELLNKASGVCFACDSTSDLSVCPCGKTCCEDHTDSSIYSDQDLCCCCAFETRKGWEGCNGHEFKAPYENEMGNMVSECKHCGFGMMVSDLPPAATGTDESTNAGAARKD